MTPKKLALLVLKPLFFLTGGLAYLLLRLLEPWRLIKAGHVNYDRIGHLSVNTESYLRARAAHPERYAHELVIAFSGPPANRQLLTMIQRRMLVIDFRPALWFYTHALLPFIQGTRHQQLFSLWGGEYLRFDEAGPQLSFTAEEERRGRALLAGMGVPEGAPFICFHARDKAYLDTTLKHNSREQWSYHDFRDCSIENYVPAAEAMAAKGLYALRVGAVVERPITPRDPKVIDYSTRFRSDFGDLYLLGHCKFFIGNDSGAISVPPCFNIPAIAANMVPLGFALWRASDIFILKRYRLKATGRIMNFPEIIAMGADLWQTKQKFDEAGIEFLENTGDEITAAAEEMNARIDGTWKAAPEDEELQRRFRALFPAAHPITGFPSRVGADFLRRHRDLLGA